MYGIVEEEAEAKFKVGDRVRVVKGGYEPGGSFHTADIGHEDTIISVGSADIRARYEGEVWFYNEDEIELVARAEQPKFKVGDRVRVIDDNGGGKVGDVGQILSLDNYTEDNPYYEIEGLSGGAHGLYEHRLQPAFLPGDKVRVTKHSGYFAAGDTGEVEHRTDNFVYVTRGPWRTSLPIVPDDIELIAEPKAGNKEQPKFKAGDIVEYADGQPGRRTIKCVKTHYSDGAPFVGGERAYDYADDGWDFERSLRLVASCGNCIVARVLDGTPRPSNIPYVHADVASATTEAERLARNNPGQEFAVYQRVAGRVAEVHYEMKEVA